MLLTDKVAVIYGGGGAIGGAIARAFQREGAEVFLAGRTKATLNAVTEHDHTYEVDALDEAAVNNFVTKVFARTGRIDITCNVIGVGDVQRPLTELSVDEFLQPISIAMRSHFLTARAAVPHMINQGSGVILAFGGNGPQTLPGLGGFKIALDAVESLRRQWSVELGRHNIRVITLRTGGIAESMPADMPGRDEIAASFVDAALLPHTATLADVGNVAAFVCSDLARTITDTEINISCGAIVD
ncbi:MAG TPA: SDR family oxidoreductase [Candidatus Limnocylindrales bacterium]|nr:SDR family oxidoreductase [Candidatus Limnocylindrales bacterium]